MESTNAIPIKKLKHNINLHVAECIRQFELPQQFPSTVTELHLTKLESEINASVMKTKKVTNVISPAPVSAMKFIPNNELPFFDNLQKLKLKLPDGRDVGEVKIVLPETNEKVKAKVITLSNLGIKSEKSFTWAIKSNTSIQNKPKVKAITTILNSSTAEESVTSRKTPNMDLKMINSNNSTSRNMQSSQLIFPNFTKITKTIGQQFKETNDSMKKNEKDFNKLYINHSNSTFTNQDSELQTNNFNSSSGSQEILTRHEANQVFKPLTDRSLKILKKNYAEHQNIANDKKMILKHYTGNGSLKKRDSSFLDNFNHLQSKKPNLTTESLDSTYFVSNTECFYNEANNSQKVNHRNESATKNMVNVPDESAEILSLRSFRPDNSQTVEKNVHNVESLTNNEIIQVNKNKIKIVNDKESIGEKNILLYSGNVKSSNIVINDKTNQHKKIIDKFSILEKAVLSVQDSNLRVKALAALKDCGIKTKKKVPLKRLLNTKIINESQTQTEIFSLLKEQEFIHVTSKSDSLSRIKQRSMVIKRPINVLYDKCVNQIHLKEDEKFKQELDNLLEKIFPMSAGVLNMKEVLSRAKRTRIKAIINQLRIDLEDSVSYDDDGLLAIHRAINKNDIQEVQKNMIILKAVGKSIDVLTQDKQTGLELAVECEADPQIIKLLLNSGAQPVSPKSIHDSAIIIAAKKSSRVLPLLFEHINQENKQLLNCKNSEGFAAIHYCAQRGNLEGITELLKHGAEVNLQDERSGKTALFYAVDTKNCEIPQDIYHDIAFKLLEYGAVSNISTFSKHSVLSVIDEIKNHSLKIALNKAVQ